MQVPGMFFSDANILKGMSCGSREVPSNFGHKSTKSWEIVMACESQQLIGYHAHVILLFCSYISKAITSYPQNLDYGYSLESPH